MNNRSPLSQLNHPFLILGGTGKTGRRVAQRLESLGFPVRIGSRSSAPAFDWHNPGTWEAALHQVKAVYVAYYPDLAVPGADNDIRAFTKLAVESGVERLVLLSGRGEPEAELSETIVKESGADWTILRSSWFFQNFSESFMLEDILHGEVALPAGAVAEPFVDAEDIAEAAVAALTREGHAGQLYEITGPLLLTFAEAVEEISRATGRKVSYRDVPAEQYSLVLEEAGLPAEFTALLNYLFTTVLDGRNSSLGDGIQRALGRAPRDFRQYARETAAAGLWNQSVAA